MALRSGGSSLVIGTLMRSKELGSTQLMVTQLGLGLAALGRPAYINIGRTEDLGGDRSVEALERRCHGMLDAAYQSGVRYVDAARSYGHAESFLASWLAKRQLPRGAVTVGSKWGYSFVGGWRIDAPVHELKDLSANQLKKQIAESRAILGDWLGLYQIHSATLESGVLEDIEVLTTLSALGADGLVIGLTVSGPRQSEVIRRAFAIQIDGTRLFQVVQATWNLLDPSAGAALAEAKALGWGVIIKEALANGRLTGRADSVPDSLQHFAAGHSTTADVVAIAAAMSQPWADVVLSGAVTTQQLLSNVSALNLVGRIIDLPSVAQTSAEYWTRRSTLSWQ
jgi:aryl-alcohol dehydrogenase-like predicted oxidoreductase